MEKLALTNRRSFLALLGIVAIDNFGFAVVIVMFSPLFLASDSLFFSHGTSLATRSFFLALVYGAYPFTQFFGAPLLGDLADRIGRRKTLFLSVAGTAIGFFLSGIACLFYSTAFLSLTRLLTGFFAGNLAICLSGIADVSPTEKMRAHNFGILATAWALSWNIAMLVGGYLSDPSKSKWLNPALPFWITTLLTLGSLGILVKLYTETHEHQDRHPFDLIKGIHNVVQALKIRLVRPFFLSLFLWTVGWGICSQWYGVYSILRFGVSQQAFSWGLFIQGMFWAIGSALINPFLVKRLSSLSLGLGGFFFTSILLFVSAIPTHFLTFNLFFLPAATLSAITFSNVMNLASITAPDAIHGKIMGISQSVMALSWTIVPILGAVAGSNFVQMFFLISGVLFFLAALVLFTKWRKAQRHIAP